MRLIASIYVDHQAEVNYPVDYVTRNLDMFDQIYFFGSDATNTIALETIRSKHSLSSKIRCIPISVKITQPSDIAKAQNACINWIRTNDTYDYILVQQADLTLSHKGIKWIEGFIKEGNNDRPAVMLSVDHNMLHTYEHQNHFGCGLIGYRSPRPDSDFTHDGAYTHQYWVSSYKPDPCHAFHVGWLSSALCAGHFRRHAKTWTGHLDGIAQEFVKIADLYDKDVKAFMKRALIYNRNRNGEALRIIDTSNVDYMDAITYYKLEKERELAMELVSEIERERSHQ